MPIIEVTEMYIEENSIVNQSSLSHGYFGRFSLMYVYYNQLEIFT